MFWALGCIVALFACGDDDPGGDRPDGGGESGAGAGGKGVAGAAGKGTAGKGTAGKGTAGTEPNPECEPEPSFIHRYTSPDETVMAHRIGLSALCGDDCPSSLDAAVRFAEQERARFEEDMDGGVGGACRATKISSCGVESVLVRYFMPARMWNYDASTGELIGAGLEHDCCEKIEGCGPIFNAGMGRPDCSNETIESLCDGENDAGL